MKHTETIVILHGILRSSGHMRKLARYLRTQGYHVLNINYPSTRHELSELAEITWNNLKDQLPADQPVHFVGYSMGGLVLRVMLARYRPAQMGRVVFLATPNKGSEVADLVQNWWPYRKLYGPAGQQLITHQESFRSLFGEVDYELGIIAGSFSVDPLSALLFNGAHDGKVSVESTKLEGMKDHAVVSASHTLFPHNAKVHSLTHAFLRTGHFDGIAE